MKFGHVTAWWVAGIFSAYATYLSIQLIKRHLNNYTQPAIQKHIIRIALMVPVYAIGSWLSLRYKEHSLYFDLLRDCYEAFIIYSFVWMISAYVGGDAKLLDILHKHPPMHHMFPLNLLYPPFKLDKWFLRKSRQYVLQYVIIKPCMTLLAIVLDENGLLDEAEYRLDRGYIYITIINSISVTIAMQGLLYMYHALAHDLEHIRPLMKLLCIKGVLFLSFWQGVIVSILAKVHIIHSTASYTVEEVETGLQDFLMCFEVVIVAIAHDIAYSEKEFAKDSSKNTNPRLWHVLGSALSVRSTLDDIYSTFAQENPKRN
eukprot:Phypoly_transcript_11459.p1 GENE.Phypoly_transcript_11459~~Phypoly_transcript_11459.p1  ORF type:complete len:316 (+),score=47.81 Phypoly_transcript_11459:125-1072(+)